jgi:hypothetical protein
MPGDSPFWGVALESAPRPRPLKEEQLRQWLHDRFGGMLPRRPNRKLTPDKLFDFLKRSRGDWFRIKDLEQHFRVGPKTAWEYLQKLLAAGLICHNRGRTAAARYCLNPDFLLGQAETFNKV